MRVYIAGPMRGYRFWNFPAFDDAAARLEHMGYDVVSPADIDRAHGCNPVIWDESFDWNSVPDNCDLKAIRARDIAAIETCDAVYPLRGWRQSRGARAEIAYAKWAGLTILEGETEWLLCGMAKRLLTVLVASSLTLVLTTLAFPRYVYGCWRSALVMGRASTARITGRTYLSKTTCRTQ